eukprot:1005047-Amphidinium_carterae.1
MVSLQEYETQIARQHFDLRTDLGLDVQTPQSQKGSERTQTLSLLVNRNSIVVEQPLSPGRSPMLKHLPARGEGHP